MTKALYNFDTCPDRSGYGSLKWDKYKSSDILPFWIADMDFQSAPEIIAAMQARLDHGVFGYTIPSEEVIEAVLDYLQSRHGYKARSAWLNFLPGLVPAINLCCRAFTGSQDSVMTTTPVYPPFLNAPDYAERELIKVPFCLNAEDAWTLDFKAMESAVKPNTRLFISCNPHNPVGRVYTRKELNQLADFCERHDLILISDEIHCDLVFDENAKHIITATLDERIAKRTITLMSPGKTYNLPGLACGFSIIEDNKLRQQFQKTIRGIINEVNCFGYAGCVAAYNHGGLWHQELLKYLRGNYEFVYDMIKNEVPEITFRPMQSTYLAWFDVSKLELENPIRFFEKNGVGLSDGVAFGDSRHVRLNFGCPRNQLQEGLKRMNKALRKR